MFEAADHHDAVSFEEWVEYCFGQGPRDFAGVGLTPDEPDRLQLEREARFDINGKTAAQYLKRLFLESDSRLTNTSDANLASGVWYVFGSGGSFFEGMRSDWEGRDNSRNPIVTTGEVVAVFDAMPSIYRDVFEHRCPSGFNPERDESSDARRLGGAVYMIWDMDQCIYLVSGSEPASADHPVTAAGFAVLATVLRECNSPACLYSALHGLGHLIETGQYQKSEPCGDLRDLCRRGQSIVDEFIKTRSSALPADVLEYARRARVGAVR